MAIAPTPAQLQLHSPALGPWFLPMGSAAALDNLALPTFSTATTTGSLAVPLTQSGSSTLAGVRWLPPAAGTLSFHFATPGRPDALASLRDVDGSPAFTDGSFVALFTLLTWVERRLDALTTASVPSNANPGPNSFSTRPMVRSFALEFTQPPVDMAAVNDLLWNGFTYPLGVTTPEEQAANLGLSWDGTSLGNGPRPMSDLLQPGQLLPATGTLQELLWIRNTSGVNLWSFDHRGRPIDPGAVASWWTFLAGTVHANMWLGPGTPAVTAPVNNGLVVHLVNGHEGPLDPAVLPLLTSAPTGVLQQASATTGYTVGFLPPAAVDALPQPMAAVLPDGSCATFPATVTAWPGGPTNAAIARDFSRIAVMSVEHELVGQVRGPTNATDPAGRRAADQARPSTAVLPGRALPLDSTGTIPALLPNSDAVLNVMADPPAGGAGVTVVASIADRDAGPLVAPLVAGAVPASAPTIALAGLDGGGTADPPGGDPAVARGQRVLATLTVGTGFAGAWVRLWPLGFDHRTAEHERLDGSAAPVDVNGIARMVVPLPDGSVSATDPPRLGFDVLIVTATGQGLFNDIRADRPEPTSVAGPVDVSVATPPLLVVSTGIEHAGALPAASVPSGSAVVAIGGSTAELVDVSTIGAAAFAAGALINRLTGGDVVQLTQPAFATQSAEPLATGDPVGTGVGTLGETGAAVNSANRQPFIPGGAWAAAGFPYPGLERLEVVMSHEPGPPGGFSGAAVVGSTPLLREFHELPNHAQGHPGAPAAPEIHGAGVLVRGSAAVDVAEYVRDRTIGTTPALVTDAAANPINEPGVPAAPSLWMATLRTEAAGVAAEYAYDLLNSVTGDAYPFDGTWENVADFLVGLPIPGAGDLTGARRALDRRILASTHGAREGATAMSAAVARAEDFVYIETPAFDHLTFGRTDDELSLWQALMDRMDAVPGLHVAVCVPHRLLPGAPEPLERIRDRAMLDAIDAMVGSDGERAQRFVAFTPAAGPARSLRIAATTMVVDDVVAIVGTTHLWRRGLSFDSSLAVSVLDDQLTRGRSATVVTFRQALMAAQLNITANELPLDAVDAIKAMGMLVERGGLGRLAAERIRPPDPDLTTGEPGFDEMDIWNPDGSFPGGDPVAWLLGLQTAVYDDTFNP